jgi:hypothetical protein
LAASSLRRLCLLKTPRGRESLEIFASPPYPHGHDHNSFAPRFPALVPCSQPQVTVPRRQRPGQLRLFSTDRFLWVWLYRVWRALLRQTGF